MILPTKSLLLLACVLCVLRLCGLTGGAPQTDAEIDALLQGIYGDTGKDTTTTTTTTTTTSTTTSTIRPVINNQTCDCVGYFQCQPDTTTSTATHNPSTSSPDTSNTGSVDPNVVGVGVIDIKSGNRIDGDDQSQCHYLQVCCKHGKSISQENATSSRPQKDLVNTCGYRNPDGVFKIVGDDEGNLALYGELPWMVAIMSREPVGGDVNINLIKCGGSIIHPQVVITGAHCVDKNKTFVIRAGEWDTLTTNELYPNQDVEVKEIIIHKDFFPGAVLNDVALLVLESPLKMTEVVQTICLPEQGENMDGRQCIVSGWGKDSFASDAPYQQILKKVEQAIVPRAECQERLQQTRLGSRFMLHKSFICAGGEIGKGDSCKGDGGGPLACPSKASPKQYILGGLVAWGVDCGTTAPSVYVDVAHFRDWIDEKMDKLNLKTSYDAKV